MRYLIWDFDGTLATRSWSQALVDYARTSFPAVQVSREDFLPHLRSGFFWHDFETPHTHVTSANVWWEHLAPVLSRAIGQVLAIAQTEAATHLPGIRATYLDPQFWSLFPDAKPCLRAVTAQGWRNVLLTNHVPELPQLLEGLGLLQYFERIFNSAETGYEKPHPTAFAGVQAALANAKAVWMIGDNYLADICGARTAGISGILVRKPHPDAEHYSESLVDLPKFLESASHSA
jgi:putative hydrolase of the HAD superfamily